MIAERNLHIIPGLRIFAGAVIYPSVLAPRAGGLLFLFHKARRLFAVSTFGEAHSGSSPSVLRTNGARFNPRP